jgi:hypothetical protein
LSVAALSGCTDVTSSDEDAPASETATLSPDDLYTARQLLVSGRQFARLDAASGPVELGDLEAQAEGVDVRSQLNDDGFRGAVERTFRGPSRTVTGAESRVLVFSTPTGAQSFAKFLTDNADTFFGGPSTARPLRLGGAQGTVIKPPVCDCPGAYPLYVGVLPEENRVLWLQITGPRVSPALLRDVFPET